MQRQATGCDRLRPVFLDYYDVKELDQEEADRDDRRMEEPIPTSLIIELLF